MKIVVLDGFTLNPGDLSWESLETLGTCTIYDRTSAEAVIERGCDAEVILTNKTVLCAETLAALPRLRYIGVLATGYNVVDVKAAAARGITVCNVPTYGTQSVAQMVFAHLLNLTQNIGQHASEVAEGAWSASPDFCFWRTPLIELAGLTMGVIGFGRIGRATARLALAFDMKVMVHDIVTPRDLPAGCVAAGLDELFRECDVISLHCPLTPETNEIVNAERIALMKPTAFLINTSRGPLIDEQALADALNQGMIAGAGLDVLTVEPAEPTNPLLTAKRCVISPHIAWATHAARERLLTVTVENVRAFMDGQPQNVV
jgi:glycerate dehydrogenase